ncbi:hypothetical protein B0T22DRAFT_481363 [Podospora appendiculata]|uniref:Uncharacterized protein n=1 Tax=Podospora appendiculata TaxID=314037 RepID=A0AAE0XCL5_9PEZI|nr:hypothetical protein B0T22DRAFT_481363 [Podospora appendiculata]
MASRFDGDIVLGNRQPALRTAELAEQHESRLGDIAMHVWCDGSHNPSDDSGGIAVTYHPWLPSMSADRNLVLAAWSVRPLWGSYFGEVLAICEALYVIWQQLLRHGNSPEVTGQLVRISIFNDKLWFLMWLGNVGLMDMKTYTLCKPLIDFIAVKSSEIHRFPGIQVRLSLHWIPGHHHNITPHVAADYMSGKIFNLGPAIFWNQHNSLWISEPHALTFLRGALAESATAAASLWPELLDRITGYIGQLRAMIAEEQRQRWPGSQAFEYGLYPCNPPYQLLVSQPNGNRLPPPSTLESIRNAPAPPPPPLEALPPPPLVDGPEPSLTLQQPLPPRPVPSEVEASGTRPLPAGMNKLLPPATLRHPLPPRPVFPPRTAPVSANLWSPWPSQRRPASATTASGSCLETSTADRQCVMPSEIRENGKVSKQDLTTKMALGTVGEGMADEKGTSIGMAEGAAREYRQALTANKVRHDDHEDKAGPAAEYVQVAVEEGMEDQIGTAFGAVEDPSVAEKQRATLDERAVAVAEDWSWREADEELQRQLEEEYQGELQLGFIPLAF